jgi:hypothetical protein
VPAINNNNSNYGYHSGVNHGSRADGRVSSTGYNGNNGGRGNHSSNQSGPANNPGITNDTVRRDRSGTPHAPITPGNPAGSTPRGTFGAGILRQAAAKGFPADRLAQLTAMLDEIARP